MPAFLYVRGIGNCAGLFVFLQTEIISMEMNFAKNIAYVACFPRNGWVEVSRDGVQARQVQARVLYPMMAVVALSAFVALLYNEEATLTGCIQSAIIEFAKYFFTYLLASYVLTGYFPAVVKDRQSADRANVVIQYCMAIIIALNIIDNLLPVAFPYLRILYCYIFFVAWKADAYLGIKEEGDKKFLIVAAALVLVIPIVIGFCLEWVLV